MQNQYYLNYYNMKNLIIGSLATLMLIICLGAGIAQKNVIYVQPSKPKHTVFLRNQSDMIYEYLAKGYQITHLSSSASSKTNYNNVFVTYIVLVKY